MYKKAPPLARPALFHVHVDAKERVPEAAVAALIAGGYTRDDFLPTSVRSSTNVAFPVNHLTWKGMHAADFRRAWLLADAILVDSGVCAYLEGELVALDAVIDAKTRRQLDARAFDEFCPLVGAADPRRTFDCPRLDGSGDIVGSEKRLLPLTVVKRRLSPRGEVAPGKAPAESGARDLFRASEVHLTLRRNGADPRLMALLGAMGLSEPIIPKAITRADGSLRLDEGSQPIVVEDMPLTLQAARDSPSLIALFDAIATRVLYEIGGVGPDDVPGIERASIKYEPASLYGFYHGRNANGSILRLFDPRVDLPEVAASIVDAAGQELASESLLSMRQEDDGSIGGESIRIDPSLLPDRPADFCAEIQRESAWTRHWRVGDLAPD